MGGFTGFGPVIHEEDEPVWHAGWEPRAFALVLAMGMTGSWNIDIARHARERLPAMQYWRSSYYEMRHYALVLQLLELGLISAIEEEEGRMIDPPKPLKRVPAAAPFPASSHQAARLTGRPIARPHSRWERKSAHGTSRPLATRGFPAMRAASRARSWPITARMCFRTAMPTGTARTRSTFTPCSFRRRTSGAAYRGTACASISGNLIWRP